MEGKTILWLEIHDPSLMELERSLLPEGYTLLRPTSLTDAEEHMRLIEQADYVICGSIPLTAAYLNRAKRLKMIQKWGVGLDKIDCQRAAQLGIPVYITAGANAIPVAELTLGLMFAVSRRIPYMDRTMREGLWVRKEMRAQGTMLHGKTIGLLGAGNIAREVAKMLRGFEETQVLYYDVKPLSREDEERLHMRYVPFETLLERSDLLSVHVPLLPETRGMIGAEQLARMKPSAILINTARGGVVDEKALVHALKTGVIRGAGLDSFEEEPIQPDNELLRLENVVLSCHCGGAAADNVVRVTRHAYGNIAAFAQGKPIAPQDMVR